QIAGHLLQADREVRTLHLAGQRGFQPFARALESEDFYFVARIVGGHEKWKALDVIPMRVRNEQAEIDRLARKFAAQTRAERTNARTRVEHDQFAIRANFH